jgi:hypothetical protein
MIQGLEHKDTMQQPSEEDEVTKRHLKFLIFLVELAEKDPDWNASLKEKAEAFGRLES